VEPSLARYALLILASSNRVYAQSSVALTQSELALFGEALLAGRIRDIKPATIGGVHYVTFESAPLGSRDLAVLANLSSAHAMFEVVGDLLRPLELRPLDRFDDDLLTIQKYSGKTNEQFTKLLLNATLLSTSFAGEFLERRFRILDPLCGRGTTLNQAMMYGFDAAGVEADRKDFEAYSAFISTWLKRKRLKHQIVAGPVRRNRQVLGRRIEISLAATKDAYRAAETQRLDVVQADTTRAGEFFRAGSFDAIVCDAPYGVQHASRMAERGSARNPLELLRAATPVWVGLLRSGGALGISWNANVADRAHVSRIFDSAGLDVMSDEPHLRFRHRVDQSIVRDLIIARKA
jgi:RMKL-like, methyltransferase domain